MKFIVIAFALLSVVLADVDKEVLDGIKEELSKTIEECATQVKASSDDLDALASHKIPSTHEGKCLLFCVHRKFNIQNADGAIDNDGNVELLAVIKTHDEDLYDKLVDVMKKCNEEVDGESDPCETAAEWAQCIMKEGKEAGVDEGLLD